MTKIIALDAGHGLKTAGKQTPDGIKEWTLNDKVRDYVVEYLKDYDCEIIFTDNNEGNTDEGLTTRRTTYINAKADVFVSIHHNAYTSTWNTATGVEVFTDRNATDADVKLANAIYKNMPNYIGLRGRGIKKENWTVINQNQIPAVLCEGGFMDSTIDYPVITSEAGQKGYARAVAEGLIEFLDLKKKVVVAAPTYTIVKTINGYMNAANAKAKKNAVSKVAAGTYYIYNEANGMKNVTKKQGTPGSWINPADNVKTATTTATNTVKAGDKVKIKSSAKKYANSTKSIPLWVKLKTYTVSQVKDSKALLKEITSWVYVSDLNVTKSATTTSAIKVGDMVGVKKGAKDYNGNKAGGVKRGVVCYRVDELKGKRAVLDKDGICTPFHVNNLFK